MPKVKVNDINMYYEIHGKGTPIICIAGLSADHQGWLAVAEILAQHYQVILFDNRGVGQTDVPETPYTGMQMATDTIALMDALNIERAHIVGNSMGGMIAQHIGINYPDRVIKLVLDSTIAKMTARLIFFNSMALQVLQTGDIIAYTRAMMLFMFTAKFFEDETKVADFLELASNNPYPITVTGLRNQINTCNSHDTTKQLTKIKSLCLVLSAEEDLLAVAAYRKQLADSIPNATLKIIPNTGHCRYIEDPAGFAETLMQFLEN